ncbi:MAG: hypothetical protein OXU62_11985, partial [Gammaproteobacteria bacterium]|nr:hypothetical protein [Gammaproteobacteria bacterium]
NNTPAKVFHLMPGFLHGLLLIQAGAVATRQNRLDSSVITSVSASPVSVFSDNPPDIHQGFEIFLNSGFFHELVHVQRHATLVYPEQQ